MEIICDGIRNRTRQIRATMIELETEIKIMFYLASFGLLAPNAIPMIAAAPHENPTGIIFIHMLNVEMITKEARMVSLFIIPAIIVIISQLKNSRNIITMHGKARFKYSPRLLKVCKVGKNQASLKPSR